MAENPNIPRPAQGGPVYKAGNFDEILNLQFDQPAKKREKDYGLRLSKAMWSQVSTGYNGYYNKRNTQWAINEKFSKGRMEKEEFIARLGIDDPKNSIIQLDPSIPKIIPSYKRATIQKFMNREEKPRVFASDISSQNQRERKKAIAIAEHQNAADYDELEQTTGVKVRQSPKFEDIEMIYQFEDRLTEEMIFEKYIWKIWGNSDYEDLKRQWISDLVDFQLAASKIVRINTATKSLPLRLKIRRCKPSRCYYNIFESPVGKDVSMFGEAYPMAIADARRLFPKITEQQWFTLAEKAKQGMGLRDPLMWQDNYIYAASRPYDDYKFNVLDFEVKVVDKDYYVKTTNSFGKPILIYKKGKPNPQSGEAIEESKFNVYCGTWAIDTEIMLNWDIAPNQLRPFQNGIDCFLNYSVVSPDADGLFVPSLIERSIPWVKRLVDTAIKIQQMTITMEPDNLAVEISGLDNVDLGNGTVPKLQLMKIKSLTGRIYWSRVDGSGVPGVENQIPFQNIPGSMNIAQINVLIQLYNFWVARLNDEWGTNPDALGQPLPAKRAVSVNENQIQAADNSSEYLYDFLVYLFNQNSYKIAMSLWDIMVFESGEYKLAEGVDESLIDKTFDVSTDMIPTLELKQRLQEKINIALKEKTISLGQSIRIENMEDVKAAELWLIKEEKKAQEDAAKANQANIEMNAQVQERSLQMKGQMDAQTIQAQAQADMIKNKAASDAAGFNELIKMVKDVHVASMQSGIPIPPELKPLVDYITRNTLQKDQPQRDQPESPQRDQPESPQDQPDQQIQAA